MSHYRPYSAYKDSGVEWIGEVPEHWKLRKVAWDMKMTIGWTPSTKNRHYYDGPYNWVSIADLTSGRVKKTKQTITQLAVDEMKGTQAPAGSLLFSYKLTIGMVALLDEPAFTNEAIAAFYPNKTVEMSFWQYAAPVILPQYSRKNIYDSDLLNQDLMNSARFFAPANKEQKAIADAINRETTRIDTLIAKKTRFIELLKEKRQAFITHAVTKGLDLHVKMKDSGVEWIGEVPEHWDITPIKRAANLRNLRTNDNPNGVEYIGLEDVESGSGKYSPTEGNSRQSEDSTVAVFNTGDVLYGKLRPYLKKAIIADQDGVCSTEFLVLDSHKVAPDLLQKWLLTSDVTQQIESTCEGAKMPRADWEGVGSVPIPVPPHDEQKLLVEAIGLETTRIDTLIEKTQRSIELLKERRSAFITAAVTGRIDLREDKNE
ncbi:MAG: restriction endonuclease subunit S [Campylobacterales bacterium]|nr:restriction endonuclease subunit S [Thiotrichales bacterium]MBD3792458.1 restriction endonuclease subunit S [Campylobacterales bacterium]